MNRKMLFCLALALLAATPFQAQENALFHTTIRVEDAMGNKDSVIVGYDPDATYDIDPEFGEVEITTPFDSVLEVRAMSPLAFNAKLSKVIIDGTEFIIGPNCHSGARINIFVWSKYQPITVSWDALQFLNEECARGSFLSNHQLDEVAGPIPPNDIPPVCVCMAAQNSYTFDLTYDGLLAQYQLTGGLDILHAVSVEAYVEGLGNQTIYGLRFNPEDTGGYTPCNWITVGTESPGGTFPLAVFPNPASGQVRIAGMESASFKDFQVFDINGCLMQTLEIKNADVDLSGLPGGIYLLQAQDGNGKRYVGRVVKL